METAPPLPPLSKGLDDLEPLPLSQGLDLALLFTTKTVTIHPYAATLGSHGRAEAGEHKLEHILLSKYINSRDSFYWQMLLEPLTLDI